MKNVFSSHVDSVGYDPETEELHVKYSKGQYCIYQEVPPDIAQDVLSSPSIGKAIHALIKKGGFEYEDGK